MVPVTAYFDITLIQLSLVREAAIYIKLEAQVDDIKGIFVPKIVPEECLKAEVGSTVIDN